jgi:hypothetical protein
VIHRNVGKVDIEPSIARILDNRLTFECSRTWGYRDWLVSSRGQLHGSDIRVRIQPRVAGRERILDLSAVAGGHGVWRADRRPAISMALENLHSLVGLFQL